MGITAVTVNACQCNMKNDTHGKFSSSLRSFIMNGPGFYYNPAQFQGFYGDSMVYPHYFPVYHDMTGRETQPSTSHASFVRENALPTRSMQASTSQANTSSSSSSSQSSTDPEPVDTGKRSYERWSDDEEKTLVNLWAENFKRINSSQARKAYDDIDNLVPSELPKNFTRKLNTSSNVTRIAKIGIANKRVVTSESQPTSTRLMQLCLAAISSR